MRVSKLVWACLIVLAMMAGSAIAQEGHPLKGSWLGEWGPNKTTRNQVFLVMDWDGKTITGTINPGTDNIPIKNATLTPPTPQPPAAGRGGGAGGGGRGGRGGRGGDGAGAAPPPPPPPPPVPQAAPSGPPQPDWLVHLEADAKDRSGNPVHYVIDGKIENIGLANRMIVGTWMVGTTKNDFRLVRQ